MSQQMPLGNLYNVMADVWAKRGFRHGTQLPQETSKIS